MKVLKEPKRRYYDIEPFFYVDYTIHSPLGEIEKGRYIQDITGRVMTYDDEPGEAKEIGTIEATKVLISNARRDYEPMVFVWDWEQYLVDLGAEIWDWDEEEFLQRIFALLKADYTGEDILILRFIEIKEEFRGYDLGKHIIKDLYNHFNSGCALFVADFNNGDAYTYFKNKKGMAEYRAKEYLIKQLGFKKLRGIKDDYLFLSPSAEPPIFEAIELL